MTDQRKLEQELSKWAEDQAMLIVQRNQLIPAALAAGIRKLRIHELSGIARTTINRIEKGES